MKFEDPAGLGLRHLCFLQVLRRVCCCSGPVQCSPSRSSSWPWRLSSSEATAIGFLAHVYLVLTGDSGGIKSQGLLRGRESPLVLRRGEADPGLVWPEASYQEDWSPRQSRREGGGVYGKWQPSFLARVLVTAAAARRCLGSSCRGLCCWGVPLRVHSAPLAYHVKGTLDF